MTTQEILDVFKAASVDSFAAGLRAVWNAGWYQGAGVTPTTTSPDRSGPGMSKPVAVLTRLKR